MIRLRKTSSEKNNKALRQNLTATTETTPAASNSSFWPSSAGQLILKNILNRCENKTNHQIPCSMPHWAIQILITKGHLAPPVSPLRFLPSVLSESPLLWFKTIVSCHIMKALLLSVLEEMAEPLYRLNIQPDLQGLLKFNKLKGSQKNLVQCLQS